MNLKIKLRSKNVFKLKLKKMWGRKEKKKYSLINHDQAGSFRIFQNKNKIR